jgi:hypothetical protein
LGAVLLCVTLCVLLLSGCDIPKGLGLVPEDESDNGGQSEEPVWNGVPVEEELNNPSIKVKFGVDVAGTDAVDAAFHELSAFIKKGGLSDSREVIKLGDWIDLEGGLSVEAYGEKNYPYNDTGKFSAGYEGETLRLIVVGINSFQSKNGYAYQGEPEPSDHVVFQFKNVPVNRRMNKTDTNDGGYARSEMRQYLVKVGDDGGNFLTGLQEAGVPDEVLWAPTRCVANGGSDAYSDLPDATDTDAMTDFLWLPTEREMFGDSYSKNYEYNPDYYSSATYETAENQARLEYYDGNDRRKKSGAEWYWESSPESIPNPGGSAAFCTVYNGITLSSRAALVGGVAPAFCVQ